MKKRKAEFLLNSWSCPRCKGSFTITSKGFLHRIYYVRCISCNTVWHDDKVLLNETLCVMENLRNRGTTQKDFSFWPIETGPQIAPMHVQRNKALELVKKLPRRASLSVLSEKLANILGEIRNVTIGEKTNVYKALKNLRTQPNIVQAMTERYKTLPHEKYNERLIILRVLGGLKRPEVLPFLIETLSKPLPSNMKPFKNDYSLSQRGNEEVLLVKAIEGIGYLRNKDSDKALLDIMSEHESRAAQIAAIDTFMWNHNDKEKAKKQLYGILPLQLHKFVDRPRFHRKINKDEFNQNMANWINKWEREQ